MSRSYQVFNFYLLQEDLTSFQRVCLAPGLSSFEDYLTLLDVNYFREDFYDLVVYTFLDEDNNPTGKKILFLDTSPDVFRSAPEGIPVIYPPQNVL